MHLEIERKFLVDKSKWKRLEKPEGKSVRQKYVLAKDGGSIRVRIKGDKGFITLKGKSKGFTRSEYEYEIPLNDAKELIEDFPGGIIEKVRYKVLFDGKLWEVDEFSGDNEGLIMAEIELKSADESPNLPEWVGKEVTLDRKYYNAHLSKNPYKNWK